MNRNSSDCPSCERFIGTAELCPYCDTDAPRPIIYQRLKLASLLLAVIGLGILYLISFLNELPLTKIGSITPMMDHALVRIAGTVKRKPYVSENGGKPDYLSILVSDGSGSIRAAAYDSKAQELLSGNQLPHQGSKVELTGTLAISAKGDIRMRIQSIEQL